MGLGVAVGILAFACIMVVGMGALFYKRHWHNAPSNMLRWAEMPWSKRWSPTAGGLSRAQRRTVFFLMNNHSIMWFRRATVHFISSTHETRDTIRKGCKNRTQCTVLIWKTFPYWLFTGVLHVFWIMHCIVLCFRIEGNVYRNLTSTVLAENCQYLIHFSTIFVCLTVYMLKHNLNRA